MPQWPCALGLHPGEGQWAEIDATEQECRVGGCLLYRWSGQWEAWQSHCQFLMGSLCFDMWLAHSDGTIIRTTRAQISEWISICYPHNTRSVSPFRVGAESSPGCLTPPSHDPAQPGRWLGPNCPCICCSVFLQRSETGQRTVGPRGATANWQISGCARRDLQRGCTATFCGTPDCIAPEVSVLIA